MKKAITFLATILLTATLSAQSPEKMTYQAVIRNGNNTLVANTQISMQISILQGSTTGTVVYVETQTPSTNTNGLVSIEVGTGVTADDFSTIDWANGPYFIKTETDATGGMSYTITGTSQLLSVPYALHAKTAETITGQITEKDPIYSGSEAASITATDIANLAKLSGVNTGDQDLSDLATKIALGDSTAQVRSEIPDISRFLTSEADPAFTNSQAANIDAEDIINLGNLVGTNTGDQDLSNLATKIALEDSIAQLRGNMPTIATYSVGDFAQGGIVFWVDETGQHGLVAAKEDQSTSIRWHAGTNGVTRATGDGLFSGKLNTLIIISSQISIGDDGSDYAAQICNELQVTEDGKTYGDWYLPSRTELNLMIANKVIINATAGENNGSDFAKAYYWSSTEGGNDRAWQQFRDVKFQGMNKKNEQHAVRAIRAF